MIKLDIFWLQRVGSESDFRGARHRVRLQRRSSTRAVWLQLRRCHHKGQYNRLPARPHTYAPRRPSWRPSWPPSRRALQRRELGNSEVDGDVASEVGSDARARTSPVVVASLWNVTATRSARRDATRPYVVVGSVTSSPPRTPPPHSFPLPRHTGTIATLIAAATGENNWFVFSSKRLSNVYN